MEDIKKLLTELTREALEARETTILIDINNLPDNIPDLITVIASNKKIELLEKTNHNLKNEVMALRIVNTKNDEILENLQKDYLKLETEITKLKSTIQDLEDELHKKDSIISMEKSSVKILREKNARLIQCNNEQRELSTSLRKQNETLQQELNHSKELNKDLTEQVFAYECALADEQATIRVLKNLLNSNN